MSCNKAQELRKKGTFKKESVVLLNCNAECEEFKEATKLRKQQELLEDEEAKSLARKARAIPSEYVCFIIFYYGVIINY